MSWALEDESEAEFREALALLGRVSLPDDSPGGGQLFCDVQVLETWLQILKRTRDDFLARSAEIEAERARLREEILEVRRREGWDPGALRIRLQLEDSLHRLVQDLFKLDEARRRAETEAKTSLLEAYSRIASQLSDLKLPPVSALLAFLDCEQPRRVLVVHEPEPLGSLPSRSA